MAPPRCPLRVGVSLTLAGVGLGGAVYGAMDMDWATLVGQLVQVYAKQK